MAWAKFDDHTDEDVAHLSIPARILFYTSVTWSRRRNLGGRFEPNELRTLCRAQGIVKPVQAADELCVPRTSDEDPAWLREGDTYVIRAYEKHNPLTSTERVRKHRKRDGNADETPHVTFHETPAGRSTSVSPRMRAGVSQARTGYPEPEPVTRSLASQASNPPVVPPSGEITERDPMVTLWLTAARGAGHSEGVCYAGIAHIADVVAEALATGESPDRIREAVRRMGAGGWYTDRALQRQLRDLVNEANAKPVNPISARIQATLARGSS